MSHRSKDHYVVLIHRMTMKAKFHVSRRRRTRSSRYFRGAAKMFIPNKIATFPSVETLHHCNKIHIVKPSGYKQTKNNPDSNQINKSKWTDRILIQYFLILLNHELKAHSLASHKKNSKKWIDSMNKLLLEY